MMADTPANVDDFSYYASGPANGFFGPMWAGTTSDAQLFGHRDRLSWTAQSAARTIPYAKNLVRAIVDNLIGSDLRLSVEIDAEALGIAPDVAIALAERIESEWFIHAEGPHFGADAMRAQTFSGMMRTRAAILATDGEVLDSIEWKPSDSGYCTCLNAIDPTRLSDPNFVVDPLTHRRMGVERDRFGEPIAYHIRRRLPSDGLWNPLDVSVWDRFERFTGWGRPKILHMFEHDRADMSRGWSTLALIAEPVRNISDILSKERDAAALRAQYGAAITSELDYESIMNVVGADTRQSLAQKGFSDMSLQYMQTRAKYYTAANVRFGDAKVVHLLPNEKLELLHATQAVGSLKELHDTHLYEIAAGAGVDWATLTRNYSQTSYSGGRYSTAENARSYDVRRDDLLTQVATPFAYAWLEEAIVVQGTIELPKNLSYYDARRYITLDWVVYGKILLDPAKEATALLTQYHAGAISLREFCHALNLDWRDVLRQRAVEKAYMAKLGLTPEDIDPSLLAPKITADAAMKKASQPAPTPSANSKNG